ncbi:LOW QUALITY PROTEIN: hypothetical protein BC936DRAFT_140803 [Jimgerdemannia flammicorona]|uniref:Uncharacterized protein n=2 Tax=Jimgerdemannia flammicorona TaxID=994334 RepID=A0A433A496_9FUNG|nr:LOW QUALITY PROTEIN: hypothetical protein BC936DRAFT_140803 [Jimgerdemannia flammicorona]RUS30776.1 LOW QUALITY PROTEIN: hypothetical protein BC938DRAFT_478979 [Jimgerdemannia flammicorona]
MGGQQDYAQGANANTIRQTRILNGPIEPHEHLDHFTNFLSTFPSSEENPKTGHAVTLEFQINMYAVSGLKVRIPQGVQAI